MGKTRYNHLKTVQKRGKAIHPTTINLPHFERDSDLHVITQEGDRLDNLAYFFYGDSSLWWVIANANNLTTLNVKTGMKMLIPK